MPTKTKIAPQKTTTKLAASVELMIVYPAKLFIKEMDTGVKDTTDKKIRKIVGRDCDTSGCEVAEVRAAKRDLRWKMIRRNRIKAIEAAVAKLGITGLKVIVSERKTA